MKYLQDIKEFFFSFLLIQTGFYLVKESLGVTTIDTSMGLMYRNGFGSFSWSGVASDFFRNLLFYMYEYIHIIIVQENNINQI